MDPFGGWISAAVTVGAALVTLAVAFVVYRRVRLRSLRWLLVYEVLMIFSATVLSPAQHRMLDSSPAAAARLGGNLLAVAPWLVMSVLFLAFLILLTRELRELQAAAPGGESPGPS